jgi:alpha-galactosidase
MRRAPLSLSLALVALALVPAGGLLHGDEPLVQINDAFVTADGAQAWTIGNPAIRYSIAATAAGLTARALVDPASGQDWHASDATDGSVTVGGVQLAFGAPGMSFVNATTTEWWGGVRLDLHYAIPSQQLEITRSYACFPMSAAIETWTTYQTGNRTVILNDLNNYTLAVPASTVRWVSGVTTPDEAGGPFTRQGGEFDDGQILQIGSDTRSSTQYVPWFGVGPADSSQFYGAIMWSGSWRLRLERHGGEIDARLGLPAFNTTLSPSGTLETPHAVFGFTTAAMPSVSMSLHGLIDRELRHGRPYSAHLSYNTWYSYGTFIDEPSLLAEMDVAASMGVEQFVVDAGWWAGIDPSDPNDFSRAWGTYTVDMVRFPDGLSALSDHAHALGMRFGVWVEPERVDRSTVGRPGGASENFLATQNGRYDPSAANTTGVSAQVCFASPAARTWVTARLEALIDAVHPDYLKWDNNFWVNCNRAGHSHGPEDGNFLHMRGVQMVRDTLRARYPDMEIEDCASGANRLSLDMLAYTDESWVSDRTSPSSRVRHNLEGLIDIFPAPYLLTFAIQTTDEQMIDDPTFDLATTMRSRMPGAFGMSVLTGGMSDGTRAELARHIALYKYIRPILLGSDSMLLSAQQIDLPDVPWSGWDVIQHVSPATGDAVVMAFDTPDAPSSTLVRPRALRTDLDYQVESADYGDLGTMHGADLMSNGIQINASDLTHSHVIILHALQATAGGQ